MAERKQPFKWDPSVPVIVGQEQLELLSSGGPRQIDRFLGPELHLLRIEYRRSGNPRYIQLALCSLARLVDRLPATRKSFQYSRLHAWMGELLIASGGDSLVLQEAVRHLEFALDILGILPFESPEVRKAQIAYVLLLGVARKALGQPDDSLAILRSTARELKGHGWASDMDLIALRRQEIMMLQTVNGHRDLAEGAASYRNLRPLEYYRSVKRVFEFVMNQGGAREAASIFPEFRRAFGSVHRFVDPISHVSFLKNVGQYAAATGDGASARIVLQRALSTAQTLSLSGQVRQVRLLLQQVEGSESRPHLTTFLVNTRSD